jgi:hypothetical protein
MAFYWWTGKKNSQWSDPQNWLTGANQPTVVPQTYPGDPELKDPKLEVLFEASTIANQSCIVDRPVQIRQLTVDAMGKDKLVTITVNQSLTITAFMLFQDKRSTITGPGRFTIQTGAHAVWLAGIMAGPGTTGVAKNATFEIGRGGKAGLNFLLLAARTMVNDGITTVGGAYIQFYGASVFNNAGDGVFKLNSFGRLSQAVDLFPQARFRNYGRFECEGSQQEDETFPVGVRFDNYRTVGVYSALDQQGTRVKGVKSLVFLGGGISRICHYTAYSGNEIVFHQSPYEWHFGVTLEGATLGPDEPKGSIILDAAQITIVKDSPSTGSGGAEVQADHLVMKGGSLVSGAGNLRVQDSFEWISGTMKGPGTTYFDSSAGRPLVVVVGPRGAKDQAGVKLDGRTVVSSSPQAGNPGTEVQLGGPTDWQMVNKTIFINGANSVFKIIDDSNVKGDGTLAFKNQGVVIKTGGKGVSSLTGGKLNPSGRLFQKSGTLRFGAQVVQMTPQDKIKYDPATLQFDSPLDLGGGSFGGAGNVIGDLANSGELDLGDIGVPGTINSTGRYAQSGASGVGTLNVDIGGTVAGTGFDQINFAGSAALSGTLNINLVGGFLPGLGNSFTILTCASRTGDFTTINGLVFGSSRFDVQYTSTGVKLVAVSYTAGSAPTVTAVTPPAGSTAGGTSVTITGTGFTGAYDVSFGGLPAQSFTAGSDTSITAVSPPQAAGTVDVTVATYNGRSATSSSDHFTYLAAPPPTITSVTPSSGPTAGGTVVTILGSHFTAVTAVAFGSIAAGSFTFVSDTSVLATSPAESAGTVDVTVTTTAGTSQTSSADRFTFTSPTAPQVTSVSPTSGGTAGGTAVTITGVNLTGATSVSFGSVAATSFTVNSDTQIVAVSPPEDVGTVDITVTTPAGTSGLNSGDRFTYTNPLAPVVTSVSPNSGPTSGGTAVYIGGSKFTGATAVAFGALGAASFYLNSDTGITATSPAQAAATVDVTVTTPSGRSATSAADHFTYVAAPLPSIFEVWPTQGLTSGGTQVSIFGNYFTGATAVYFGAVPATSFTVYSDQWILAVSPPEAPGTVDVTVTTPSGISNLVTQDHFMYVTSLLPQVVAVHPNSGPTSGNTRVLITGGSFSGTRAVSFGDTPAKSFTVNSPSSITAYSPAHAAGTVDVTVTTWDGTSATSPADQFTYVSSGVPWIASKSPSSGTSGGGTPLILTGSGFSGSNSVSFGNRLATDFRILSDTVMTATAPPLDAGTWDITVTNPTGTSVTSSADQFSSTAASAPSVTAVSPSSSSTAGGTLVTVTGTAFTGAYSVMFGGVLASSFWAVTDTSLLAVAPPHAAGTVDIVVTTPTGSSAIASADHFTYTAAPAPAITGISPSSGSTAGGTVVTVSGSGFTGASAVSFGTVAAAGFSVLTDSTLLAIAPSQVAATVHMTVTTPSGTSSTSGADQFTYTAAALPAVTAVTPTSGTMAGATTVAVTGSGFTGATAVSFGGTAAPSFTVVSDTAITVTSPYHASGTVDITVTTPSGTSTTSAADQYSYVYVSGPAPAVTAISPTSGTTAGGTVVNVTGTGFTGATAVKFGSTAAASYTVNSDTSLSATSPSGSAGTVDILVTTPSGTSTATLADQFTYVAASVPAVTGVSPSSGSTGGGTAVSVTGTAFTGATAVSFGLFPATAYAVNSDTSITATAPVQAAGTVDVTVTTPAGTSPTGTPDRFTYNAAAAPSITALTTTTGGTGGGTTVRIIGSGLTGASSVYFGSVPATTFTVNSDSMITVTSPPHSAGTWDVTVTTPTGTSALTSMDRFTYTAATAPSVSSISPTSGSTAGGTSVGITGSGFTGAQAVSFGTVPATFTVNSDTSVTATAPPQAAGTVHVTVSAPSGTSTSTNADQFTYTAAPVPAVTGIAPTTGSTAGGTPVTITGSGFTSATAVTFGTVGAAGFTVNSDTSISATSPPQAAGTIDVTVTTPSGTSATSSSDRFTYTAAASPVVTAITPNSGSPAGGATVTITGSAFTGATAVNFGSTAARTFTVVSDTAITALVPAQAAGTVDVTVTTFSGTSGISAADRYTYTAAPVPVITGLSPNTGSTAGGTVVMVTGTGFTGAGSLSFAGVTVAFTVYSDTLIVTTSPPFGAGVWDVQVTTPGGTSALVAADRFTYTAASTPSVASITPTSFSTGGGAIVTITGSGFTGATAVNFGTVPATSFTVVSDTSIEATAPPQPAATVGITVTTPTGTSAIPVGVQVTYTDAGVASITGASPTSGSTAGGDVVTVTGAGFTGASQVTFGSVAASAFSVVSDTQVLATAPPQAAGTVHIVVTNPSGTSSTGPADQFTYSAAPLPTVSTVTPTSGDTGGGTLVSVIGTGFTGASAVNFGTTPALSFSVISDVALTVVAPAQAAGTVHITVVTPSGTSGTSSADQFTYQAPAAPTVTAVSPSSGSTGGSITTHVTGTSFTDASAIYFGSLPALSFTVNSDTQITALVPPQVAGTVDVVVVDPTGASARSSADHFTYVAAAVPSVTGVSPNTGSGAGGTPVVLTGTALTGASAVSFGTTAATSFTVVSDTSISVTSPPHAAGQIDITVTTPTGTSSTSAADQFTYTAPAQPTVTGVSPNTGTTAGGTTAYVSGTAFTAALSVAFGSTNAPSFTVLSDALLAVVVPPQAAGTVHITLTTYGGTSSTSSADQFTYSNAAQPAVTAISPTSGPVAGGTVVTVVGSAFTGATGVKFGATAASSYTVNSDTSVTASSPPGSAGTVDVTVSTYSGTSATSSADQFTYS